MHIDRDQRNNFIAQLLRQVALDLLDERVEPPFTDLCGTMPSRNRSRETRRLPCGRIDGVTTVRHRVDQVKFKFDEDAESAPELDVPHVVRQRPFSDGPIPTTRPERVARDE